MFLEYLQPSAELFHLRIDEPVTTATDLVLTAVCIVAFIGINRQVKERLLRLYFTFYFLALGAGAFFGGILGHAFLYRLDPHWKLLSWILILSSVAILVQALIIIARPFAGSRLANWLSLLNLTAFALACFFTIRTLLFSPVACYSAFGLVLLAGPISVILFVRTGNRGMFRFILAVGVGIAAGIIFSSGWGISPWFIHSDICHLLLGISAWLIYRGILRIAHDPPLPVA